MARLRLNFIGGQITDNPLTAAATTMNSDAFAAMPTIASPDYAAITLDPDGNEGMPEIAWVTAHTAGATSATVSRGQEGTTALQHSQDVYWAHGPTLKDFSVGAGGRLNLSATPYTVAANGVTWLAWDAETEDTLAFHDLSTNPTRIVVPSGYAGAYIVSVNLLWTNTFDTGGYAVGSQIRKNGTTVVGNATPLAKGSTTSHESTFQVERVVLADGDYIEIGAINNNPSVAGSLVGAGGSSASFSLVQPG